MSDYRRWISYIYSYDHGEKKNNAGYARIELKDGRVKMTIYMTPGRKEGNVKVCFYKGQQGHLAGIPLGNLDLSVPSPVFRTETSASNVMDSGLFFVEMNGLLLVKEDGQYYASSWEEEALGEDVARDIIRLLNGKQNEKNEEKTEQTEGIKEETEAGSQKAQKEEAKSQTKQQEDVPKTKALKIAEVKGTPKMANMSERAGTQTEEDEKTEIRKEKGTSGTEEKRMEPQKENDAETESCEKEKCEQGSGCGQESNCEQDSGGGQESNCEQDSGGGQESNCEQDSEGGQEDNRPQAAKPEKETKETRKTETTRMTETPYKNCCMGASPAERIFCCLPPMYPFEEAKYEKGVRMTPQDIGMLPRSLWKLAGNSFLLHAYYTYHHLLFVKQRQKDGPLYFLMLPGVYSDKEQNLALMFGFCNFCTAKRKTLEQGDFGYWYLEVNF